MNDLTMGELANESFSNTEGLTAAQYEEISKQTLAVLQAAKAARDAQTASTGCKKPLINMGKKKEAYEKCLAENKKATTTPAPTYTPYVPEAKPFFKTGAGITVIVVGSLAVLVGGFLLIKRFKK
jgi:hypothetical protein